MKHSRIIILSLFVLCFFFVAFGKFSKNNDSIIQAKSDKLAVLWTSGDREVALKMVFMYTFNSKKRGWWKDVQLIIWGPSAKLLAVDSELQEYVKQMKEEGIELLACKACADMYGVTEKLGEMGVDVKYMGVPLTDTIKSGTHLVTF